MAIDISDPRYDDYAPDEPDQCEACGVYLDEDDVVLVRDIEPNADGEFDLLNVCEACARRYEPNPDPAPEGLARIPGRAWVD